MSIKDAQRAYDNRCEDDEEEYNPKVLEICRVKFDEEYFFESLYEQAPDDLQPLLLRIATGEEPDMPTLMLVADRLRNFYAKTLDIFTDDNYSAELREWEKQNEII